MDAESLSHEEGPITARRLRYTIFLMVQPQRLRSQAFASASERRNAERTAAPRRPSFDSPICLRTPIATSRPTEGQFNNAEEVNARLAELISGGRISERAAAWKQDDPKWRAQQLAYDALETDDPAEAVRLVNAALVLDPNCTDAERLMVSILPMDNDSRLRLLRELVSKTEQNIGEDFFTENMGHFWGILETRPYMRARQHLGEFLVQQGRFADAIPVYERIIELNSKDNLGTRFPLLGLYLAHSQTERANRLFEQFPDDERFLAGFAWATYSSGSLAICPGPRCWFPPGRSTPTPSDTSQPEGDSADPPSAFSGDESDMICASRRSPRPGWRTHRFRGGCAPSRPSSLIGTPVICS